MALKGIKVIEMAGLAPAPFCGMMLRDFGASVIRVDKTQPGVYPDFLARGKKSIAVNLKEPDGVNVVRKLCQSADVLIEPYRRGIMEKLGLGPDGIMKENPRLVYARLTGFGQTGCLADRAGHDINFLSISGVLSRLGRAHEKPTAPVNLLADFAGGGVMCAWGIVLALLERERSGKGQLIDSSMVEGAAYVSSFLHRSANMVLMGNPRGKNVLDTGVHFYDTFKTKDDKYMAVGALEPQFYSKFVSLLGFKSDELPAFGDFASLKEVVEKRFLTRTQTEWTEIFENTDSCVTPVLEMDEAALHPHNRERGSFQVGSTGCLEPRPAPILSRTPGVAGTKDPEVGEHTVEVLQSVRYDAKQISSLLERGVVKKYQESKL